MPRSIRQLLPLAALSAAVVFAAPLTAQQHGGQRGEKHAAKQGGKQGAKRGQRGGGEQHGGQHGAEEAHGASGWAALDAYHALMASAWHPVKKSGDVAPARRVAPELATQAAVWAAETAPAGCDTPEIAKAIADVKTDSQAFAALVAAEPSDAMVKAAIAALHETFEVVERGCTPAGR